MNKALITKAEAFLKDTYEKSIYMQNNPADHYYRLEHAYRVANIAKQIAMAEGFDVTYAVIAGLLHDISYCEEMQTQDDWTNHGRRSAQMIRTFLESLGIPNHTINDICYGIAIHVDDQADFQWSRTPFCETVGDADNIDRLDAYRIYEHLEFSQFSKMDLDEKQEKVAAMIHKLNQQKKIQLGTPTATALWLQRLDDYLNFYYRLERQLNNSRMIL